MPHEQFRDRIRKIGSRVRDFIEDARQAFRLVTSPATGSSVAAEAIPMIFKIIDTVDPELAALPSLILLVNPSSLDYGMQKLVSRDKTLGGYTEEHWGDRYDVISASGSTLGFFSHDSEFIRAREPLQNKNILKILVDGPVRRNTPAYRNFMDLLEFYRLNAASQELVMGRTSHFGRVNLTFDDGSFDGYFTSFSVNETADMPYRFEYTFEFKVFKTVFRIGI